MSKTISSIHPVILSGGSGTRLWPLSRANYPKQMHALVGEHTMLQATLLRAQCLESAQAPLIICNSEHRFFVREQCEDIGVRPAAVYLEPIGRNTAPAIALAAFHLAESNPEAIMLVLPADHVIQDQKAFAQAVATAVTAAEHGYLATFGIVPTAPETGYGYIQAGEALQFESTAAFKIFAIQKFVEKPNQDLAQAYLQQGGYSWNSGMFVFSARQYLAELALHRPDIHAAAQQAWQQRHDDIGFTRPDEHQFAACPSDSIDYAVMQPTRRAVVIPAEFGWSDVGAWDSLWQISPKDADGNATQGDTYLADTHNSYVRAETRQVSVIGLDDVIVVETADAVLVMHKDKAQQIKHVVQHFETHGRQEHIEHARTHRPWGWFEAIDKGERFQVKRIMVKPGASLSLQMHHHRAEHWIVVSGTAKVIMGDEQMLLTENQSTFIPLGRVHQLLNPGRIPLHMIEVQSGSYLGEDDIVRLTDLYGRIAGSDVHGT